MIVIPVQLLAVQLGLIVLLPAVVRSIPIRVRSHVVEVRGTEAAMMVPLDAASMPPAAHDDEPLFTEMFAGTAPLALYCVAATAPAPV